jgi:hypothetical protein
MIGDRGLRALAGSRSGRPPIRERRQAIACSADCGYRISIGVGYGHCDALITAAMSSARPRWQRTSAVIEAGRTRREDDPAAATRELIVPSEPSKS